MSRIPIIALAGLASILVVSASQAQQQQPQFATTKVDGTDNVYIFRYVGHQSMFVVTPEGVIATDPISERRPAAQAYINEIKKITNAPIKYVIYSHSHLDHIAGGKPFKDLGATFIAHENAKKRLQEINFPDVVIPDEVVTGSKRDITLGGTTIELNYVGKNHSDNMLVMRLPRERVMFTVDWIPIQAVQFRGMADTYLPDIEESLKKVIAMDYNVMIPGHPGPGGKQTGTKEDATNQLAYLQDLSAAVKQAVNENKSYDQAEKEIKLPKYEKWGGYGPFLPMNIERYYDFWNRGI